MKPEVNTAMRDRQVALDRLKDAREPPREANPEALAIATAEALQFVVLEYEAHERWVSDRLTT